VPNTPDVTTPYLDAGPVQDDALLPINPFYALRYQFGMLLGVEDFEAAQAYSRGKMRLHNAWLHGEGVVWGFGVTAPPVSPSDATLRGEIQVDPGLAIDSLGHELHLDAAACVNVAAWYDQHKDDADLTVESTESGGVIFKAHIEVRFRACLTRQVPAMSEPCDANSAGTAYSRAFETVEIKLVPGPAPARTYPYHLLRLLFGIDEPSGPELTEDEQAVLDALATIAGLLSAEQPRAFLAAFRRFAALDVIALRPGQSADLSRTLLFPGDEDAPVVIAALELQLEPAEGSGSALRLTFAAIDPTVRPSHVATSTIQELNLWRSAPTVIAEVDVPEGPRIDRSSVAFTVSDRPLPESVRPIDSTGAMVQFKAVGDLDEHTVKPAAFSMTYLDPKNRREEGWQPMTIQSASLEGRVVTLKVTPLPPVGARVRLIAHGTGPTPLLGKEGVPLFGATDDPPQGTRYDGNDFIHMWIGRQS
jgi:hypothetical protein